MTKTQNGSEDTVQEIQYNNSWFLNWITTVTHRTLNKVRLLDDIRPTPKVMCGSPWEEGSNSVPVMYCFVYIKKHLTHAGLYKAYMYCNCTVTL